MEVGKMEVGKMGVVEHVFITRKTVQFIHLITHSLYLRPFCISHMG